MATCDLDRMQRMLDQRRAAFAALRYHTEQLDDARRVMNDSKHALQLTARGHGADVIERLLKLSLTQAMLIEQAEVETYPGDNGRRFETGASFKTWQAYVRGRKRFEQLQEQCNAQKAAIAEKFAVVDPLLDAVREWGFPMAALET